MMMVNLVVTPTAPSSSVTDERVPIPSFNRAISPPHKMNEQHQQNQQPSIMWATTKSSSYHPLMDMLHGGHQLVDWSTIWAELGTTAAAAAKGSTLDFNHHHPPRQDRHTSGIVDSNPWAAGCSAASDTTLMTTTTTTTTATTEEELWGLPKENQYSTFDQAQDSVTNLPRKIRQSPALLQDDDEVSCLDDTDEESDDEEEEEEGEEEYEYENEEEEEDDDEDERSQSFVPVRTIWITVVTSPKHGDGEIDRLDDDDDGDDGHTYDEKTSVDQKECLIRLKQNHVSDQGREYDCCADDDEEDW